MTRKEIDRIVGDQFYGHRSGEQDNFFSAAIVACERVAAAVREAERTNIGSEIAALSAQVEKLEKVAGLADALAGEFEQAVASREPIRGMQVTPSGDFIACAQLPSAVSRMRWWARAIRSALAALEGGK